MHRPPLHRHALPALALAILCISADARLAAAVVRNAPAITVSANVAWDSLKLVWNDLGEDRDEHLGNPIGNSHIGAKIRGGVGTETFHLNNKTFWSGWPGDYTDPKRRDALVATRAALTAGDYERAETTAKGMWSAAPSAGYLPLGKLLLDFDHGAANATGYARELDLDRALSTVRYTIGGVTYVREAFASHPDRVIVVRLSASQPGKLTVTARLENPPEMGERGSVGLEGRDTLVMRSRAPSSDLKTWDPVKGMRHETLVRVRPVGGRVSPGAAPGSIRVENADSVVLILADATSYNGYDKEPGAQGVDPAPLVRADLAGVEKKSYDTLFAAHVADVRPLFRRVWVELPPGDAQARLHALTYQFMRYSMIAVSRTGDVPHNLLGLWSQRWEAYSRGQFFLNENVQKYYGLIETGNLSETGAPLWKWMTALAANGAVTARVDWGFKGWMTSHSTDLWAVTPLKSGNNEWAIWPMGGLWLCQNLWDHYAFSQDEKFLRETAYPIFKGAAEFALDYLVADKDGTLVTSPSTSPENRFGLDDGGKLYAVTLGSTIDLALIRELFENIITASQRLGIDAEFHDRLAATLPRLKPFQISRRASSKGELQEWAIDHSRVPDDTRKRFTPHRHTSHVVSVWPLRQINEYRTPELFAAAKLALANRGGGGYHPDKAAMWARLKEGDKALAALGGRGHKTAGLYPPLYSAFAELLVQSHAGEIELLPALPAAWARSGRVVGLRARGGYTLSLEWAAGKLVRCQIDSDTGAIPVVRYEKKLLDLARDSRVTLNQLRAPAKAP